jgi:hypothetical protein
MSRVRLEGNLPPSLVSLRIRRKGVVGGFVVDFHRHAVAGIPVTLERRTRAGWRRLSNRKTSALGGYAFKVKPGSYRVRATLAGRFAARSRPLRVRR